MSVAVLRNGDKGFDLSELILEFGQLDESEEEDEDQENDVGNGNTLDEERTERQQRHEAMVVGDESPTRRSP